MTLGTAFLADSLMGGLNGGGAGTRYVRAAKDWTPHDLR